MDSDDHEDEPERICPMTGSYCTGLFCDDYGVCAKENGFWDDDEDPAHD